MAELPYGAIIAPYNDLTNENYLRRYVGALRYPGAVVTEQRDARPLHMWVATDLRRRVLDGEFDVGAKLPSLRQLAAEYRVSEVTAHTAIRALQAEGVLKSTTGRGTFVQALPADSTPSNVQEQLAQLRSNLRDLAARVEELENHAEQSTSDHSSRP